MEDNLKRLVSETTRLCRDAGIQAEPQVIAYVAALQDAVKAWEDILPGCSLNQFLEPRAISAIGQRLFEQVAKRGDATVATARLQIMMEVSFQQQRSKLELEVSERGEQTSMLARAVTGPRPIKDSTMPSYEKFYKRVMEYVCTEAGLERAMTEIVAGEEVRAAMESVFPLSTLARFLTLSEEEKLQQVEELARITLGICLFNQASGKGGHALPAGSTSYLPQATRLLRDLGRHIADADRDMGVLSAGLARQDGGVTDVGRQELIFCAQALMLLESLRSDLESGLDAAEQMEGELQHLILQAQDTVGGAVAVAKEQVFPLFDRLGSVQLTLSEELRMLVVRQRLFDNLLELKQAGPTAVLRSLPNLLGGGESLSEEPSAVLDSVPEGVEYIAPSSSTGVRQLPPDLALSGLCPVALAQPDTLLARADPTVGYLRYKDQLLGFASQDAMRKFLAGPTDVMSATSLHVKRYPLLARLTGRTAEFKQLDLRTIVAIMSGPLKVDFGCQTPTHFLEKHLDVNYEWNEWALRRRALALANLRQKKTHSTQTAKTHFKRDGETQVWKPKDTEVQTKVNKGQAMPKKLQYVAGLRGAPNVKMNVVRLDLDLGQPHQH